MKGESNGPIGTILTIILVLFKIREGSVLLHCCLGRRLEAELKNIPSYTAPRLPLLTQLLSPRHNLSHQSFLLAEGWRTCGIKEIGEEY